MKLGSETGSLVNHVMTSVAQSSAVSVGDPATVCGWSDRKAGTVVKVTPAQIHVQEDISRRTDANGMSECQKYEYTPDPDGRIHVFRKTRKGTWKSTTGGGLALGFKQTYHDYSF